MDGQQPSTSKYYRPELDVVRFIAFLLVFIHHFLLPVSHDPSLARLPHGFNAIFLALLDCFSFGLSLFFTLSAFLICELLLRERQATGAVQIKQFYIRRILRIWPLYYLGVAGAVAIALLPGGPRGDVVRGAWYAVFLGSWYSAFYGAPLSPLSPLWSISVEEQFYLFVPWVIKYLSRRSLFVFSALSLFAINAWLYQLGRMPVVDYRIWFDSFVQFECFFAGILLCLLLRGRIPMLALWQRLAILLCSFLAWFYACYGLHSRFAPYGNPGSWPLIAGYALTSLGAALILLAALGLNAKLLPRWAVYLGRISFGLYVYHEFAMYLMTKLPIGHLVRYNAVIYLLKGVVGLALTILLASLSYRYFETPFLRMKKRHSVIDSQPVPDPR